MTTEEEKQNFINSLVRILSSRENVAAMLLIESENGFESISTHQSPVFQFGILRTADEVLSKRFHMNISSSIKSGDTKVNEEILAIELSGKFPGGVN